MVRQVKKICVFMLVLLITAGAICTAVSAATYTTYDGNISSTQLTYFRDILPGIKLTDNYVCFRAEQNVYHMVVGDLEYSNGVFTLNDSGRIYTVDNNGSNYSSYYTYSNATINDFKLNVENKIVYSDIGNYPQLEERGQKYESLSLILLSIACVCFVIRSIFYYRKR